MKSQDIAILLWIELQNETPLQKDIAAGLIISNSEVSESLERSRMTGLLSDCKTRVMMAPLLEFIEYGIQYVFPALPGPIGNGIRVRLDQTSSLSRGSDIPFVWRHSSDQIMGQTIQPLYPSIPKAVTAQPVFHNIIGLVDMIRIGDLSSRDKLVRMLKRALNIRRACTMPLER